MPLRDHFHSPLADIHPWQSFHAAWATEIMRTLNRHVLPAGCFAAAQVHVGSRVEIGVATFQQEQEAYRGLVEANGGGLAVETWAPPQATIVVPAVFPDEIEVQIFRRSGGTTLVGAIVLVSPGNKDRPDTRRALAMKCATYLQQGIGLVIVDIVTDRQSNLHNEMIHLLRQDDAAAFAEDTPLYAVSYRPGRLETAEQIEMWLHGFALEQPLPTMPLALRGVATVPVDLETTYATTCLDCRL